MFSVVKPEIKIREREVVTVPEIWTQKRIAQFYVLYPDVSSDEEFLKNVQELKKPSANWNRIKCQVLMSRLSKFSI